MHALNCEFAACLKRGRRRRASCRSGKHFVCGKHRQRLVGRFVVLDRRLVWKMRTTMHSKIDENIIFFTIKIIVLENIFGEIG